MSPWSRFIKRNLFPLFWRYVQGRRGFSPETFAEALGNHIWAAAADVRSSSGLGLYFHYTDVQFIKSEGTDVMSLCGHLYFPRSLECSPCEYFVMKLFFFP